MTIHRKLETDMKKLDDQFTAKATMDRETLREYNKVCNPQDIVKDHLVSRARNS